MQTRLCDLHVCFSFYQTPVSATQEELNTTKCVFWDFNLEDGVGDWSTDGCVLAGVTEKEVACHCSHATNFAILVVNKTSAFVLLAKVFV